MSDLIIYENVFEVEYDNFMIQYSVESDTYSAHHFDEEKHPDDIILEDKEDKFSVDTLLFNEYNLTVGEFEEVKKLISEQMYRLI
jgi:hypothetical protein